MLEVEKCHEMFEMLDWVEGRNAAQNLVFTLLLRRINTSVGVFHKKTCQFR